MSTLTVELPQDLSPERARFLLAVQLYEDGEVSLGYAAELTGTSVGAFAEALGRRGVPVIDYPTEDLDGEVAVLDRLSQSRGTDAA